jgi:hypothetical protein
VNYDSILYETTLHCNIISLRECISGRLEYETEEFLERVVPFCLDNGITVETRSERGGIEGTVEVIKDRGVKPVVVPTPTTSEYHSEVLDAITHFAHEVIDNELRCPFQCWLRRTVCRRQARFRS